jgi:uncharacterized membrane protein
VGSNPTLSAKELFIVKTLRDDNRAVRAVLLSSALAVGLYIVGVLVFRVVGPWYLSTNLLLALIPLVVGRGLVGVVDRYGWQDIRSVVMTGLWLVFLPNSFYLITDVLHLVDSRHGFDPLYAVVVFWLFATIGMAIGFMSLLTVHRLMRRRLSVSAAYLMAELILLVSSVGLYLGRVLRWNSWDVVLHPLAVVRDVGLTLMRPTMEGMMVVVMFFVLLSGLYAVVWMLGVSGTVRSK